MVIQRKGDVIERILAAGGDNPHDRIDARPGGGNPEAEKLDSLDSCIYLAATASGRVPLLKSVMSTACEMNCNYCGMRAGRDRVRRMLFTPDEMAAGFIKLVEKKLVRGLFLSSTIIGGGVRSQDRIIETADILRGKYRYQGYIHLKIMPWAEREQIVRAATFANRLSLNLEGTDQAKLSQLAPRKEFAGAMLNRLQWAREIVKEQQDAAPQSRRVTLATQFVVGAAGETDVDLLALSQGLIRSLDLTRVYFASFTPIRDTPFENKEPSDPLREFRLYQASFLIRDYGWDLEEIPFGADGYLDKTIDPKRAWAESHLRQRPIEIMLASPAELLRLPGIGPRGAEKIIHARAKGRIRDLRHLSQLGIRGVNAAAPYILLDGQRPIQQLRLF